MSARAGFEPDAYLASLADLPDDSIDLARAALALAALAHPGLSTERYEFHLSKITQDVATRHAALLQAGAQDDVQTRLAALKHVLADAEGYHGDRISYNDLQNADLIRVIDRRKGLPVSLAILYIHAGRSQGWDLCGLDFPGHFLVRIEKDGRRVVFDPFEGCRVLDAAALRALIKSMRGPQAELDAAYFEPASQRSILMRLQNNIKFRQIDVEDYEAALATVRVMQRIDPREVRLLLEAGVLCARTNQPVAAIAALESYIKQAPSYYDRQEALLLLRELRESLH